MPPKQPKPRQNPQINPSDRLALAITGLKTGKYTTIHEAASSYNVPESTLRARLKSLKSLQSTRNRSRANTNTNNHKPLRLSKTEENTLVNWITTLHESGHAIAPGIIQDMANALLDKRSGQNGFRVTKGWVEGYLEFHPGLAAIVEEGRGRGDPVDVGSSPDAGVLEGDGDGECVLRLDGDGLHHLAAVERMRYRLYGVESTWSPGGEDWRLCRDED